MESDATAFIPILVVILISFFYEKLSSKKDKSQGGGNPPAPKPKLTRLQELAEQLNKDAVAADSEIHDSLRDIFAQKGSKRPTKQHSKQSSTKPESSQADKDSSLFLEGQRVTTDEPLPATKPRQTSPNIPPPPGGDLKNAIIWGEILRRKF